MTLNVLLRNLVDGASNKIENCKQMNEFGFAHFEFEAGNKKKETEVEMSRKKLITQI